MSLNLVHKTQSVAIDAKYWLSYHSIWFCSKEILLYILVPVQKLIVKYALLIRSLTHGRLCWKGLITRDIRQTRSHSTARTVILRVCLRKEFILPQRNSLHFHIARVLYSM